MAFCGGEGTNGEDKRERRLLNMGPIGLSGLPMLGPHMGLFTLQCFPLQLFFFNLGLCFCFSGYGNPNTVSTFSIFRMNQKILEFEWTWMVKF